MDLFYIIESICEHIRGRFEDTNIYINSVPQGFVRPSFYVGLVDFSDKDLNLGTISRRATFEIVYFAPINSRGLTDKTQQYAAYITMASLFSNHSLAVKDRYLKIVSKNGDLTDSEAHLSVDLEYTVDNDSIDATENLYELMRELSLKYTTK